MTVRLDSMLAALALSAALFVSGAARSAEAAATPGPFVDRLVRNGVVVDFSLAPAAPLQAVTEGEFADVRFRITDEAGGQPIRGVAPGAWMDMAQVIQGQGAEQKSCKDKVSLYLKGAIGIRPMVDLNSYYVLLLNDDASVAVVDPVVSMAGSTSTLASVALKAPGADWVASDRERRLYITMPKAGLVAVMDTETFKLVKHFEAGRTPVRIALQPDGRFLWVGNNADDAGSGVTVIDTDSGKAVAFLATGAGHHEIAFSADSRHAFVSNRLAGTVSVIDVAKRRLLKTLNTGPQPLSIAHSALSGSLYVADGQDGRVTVIDGERLAVSARIALKPGLGPLRVTPDGRFALAVNPQEDLVHVIDVASNEAVQDIPIAGQPFQVTFTASYAYVRSMHSERVNMINLATLGRGRQAAVQTFSAGERPPRASGGVAIADSVAVAAGEGTVFVVNPADGTTYYYMEGMNATSSSYRVHGSSPRAVTVVDRSLKEVEPGVYAGRVRIPVAGRYDVAFMLQSPQVMHCFTAQAATNPATAQAKAPLDVRFETTQRRFSVNQTAAIRFRVNDGATGQPKAGLAGITSLHFLAPGRRRAEAAVAEIGGGVYEARVPLTEAGAWYVYIGVAPLRIGYGQLPYFSLQALPEAEVKSPLAVR